MTQEEKQLLLVDLCGRLPYGVKVLTYKLDYFHNPSSIETLYEINEDGYISTVESDTLRPIDKPYLFPLSSMTEEQKIECFKGTPLEIDKYGDISVKDDLYGNSHYTDLEIYLEVINWLNKNHFDYRGLIEKGLAINATGLNIY